MDDMFEEEAARLRAEALAQDASPDHRAAREVKRAAEHAQGVRLGWWDADGNAPEADEPEDDGEEEED